MSDNKTHKKKNSYLLINPYIEGDMQKLFHSSSPQRAAKKAWENVSKFVAHYVPEMYITLEHAGKSSLYHFKIKETKIKNKQNPKQNIKFSIEPFTNNVSSEHITTFKEKLEEAKLKGKEAKARHDKKVAKMKGGGKYDDSSSDSDNDDSEYYKKSQRRKLIESQKYLISWWYDPLIYGSITEFIVPTLISPLYSPVTLVLSHSSLPIYIP